MWYRYEPIPDDHYRRNFDAALSRFRDSNRLKFLTCAIIIFFVTLTFDLSGITRNNENIAGVLYQNDAVEKSAAMPNFIFILADDVGWNNIGTDNEYFFPQGYANLKKLASDGLIIKNYYGQELCTPSRAALLTGRYPLGLGLAYSPVSTMGTLSLNVNETTLANVLKDAGYSTHMMGKWHLGHYANDLLPTARGFDTYFGYTQGQNYYWSKKNPHYPDYNDFLQSNSSCYEPYSGKDYLNFSTHIYRDNAINIINTHDQTKPLFMYLPFQAAHVPFDDVEGNHSLGIPASYLSATLSESVLAVAGGMKRQYAMSVSILDKAVAEIVEALTLSGLMENTYLIFASDNGGCYGGGGISGPLRGTKGSLFEGGVKVDSFIYSPLLSSELQGTSYMGLFHVSDWFPTLLELAGIEYTPSSGYELDGISQVVGWEDRSTTVSTGPRTSMLYNWYTDVEDTYFDIWTNGTFAVRNDRFKLIHAFNNSNALWYSHYEYLSDNDDDLTTLNECKNFDFTGNFMFMLFDLWEDPYEEKNLYDSEETVHIEAKESLYAYLFQQKAGSAECVGDYCDFSYATVYSVWDGHDSYIVPWIDSAATGRSGPSDCFPKIILD